jgi:hypothetical protein
VWIRHGASFTPHAIKFVFASFAVDDPQSNADIREK